MFKRKLRTSGLPFLLGIILTTQAGATNCNTRAFSADWLSGSYGVACELRTVSSGNVRGFCLVEHYNPVSREFYLNEVEVDGRFSILNDCFIDGSLRFDRKTTVPVVGRAWANQGPNPDEAFVMPKDNQTVSFF